MFGSSYKSVDGYNGMIFIYIIP